MKLNTILLLALLFCSVAFAVNPPLQALQEWLGFMIALLVPIIIILVMFASVVYILGQLFGAELRARASVYASNLLAAVGVGVVMLTLFFFLLPFFGSDGTVHGEVRVDIDAQISSLVAVAESTLLVLIILMVMISAVLFVLGNITEAQTRARANVWATGMLAGALLGAVIYVLLSQIIPSFGDSIIRGTEEDFGLRNYGIVIINISFLVSFIILITYLVSKFLKIPEWEAYLNIELSQLFNSFIVLVFVVGFFAASTLVSASISGSSSSPPIAAATFLRERVANDVLTGLYDVYTIQACTSIMNTYSRRIGEFVLTNVFKIFPGIDTFVSISNVLTFGLISVYGSLSFQITILTFVDAIAVPLLLPAGLILRFLPPTRDAGSFLISMAFGFQIVFPTTFLIHEQVLNEIEVERYNTPNLLIASLCGPLKYGAAGFFLNPESFGVSPSTPIIGPLWTLLMRVMSEAFLNVVSMTEFIPIMNQLAVLSLLALFMPGLSMLITIAFINALSKFLVSKV